LAADPFTMRDGERTIQFGEGTAAEAPGLLSEHGFELTSRDDAAAPWTRDYVYGVNIRLEPHADH